MRRAAPQTLGRATHHCRKAADDINASPAWGSKQEYPSAEGESPALKQAPKSSGSVPGAVIAQSAKAPAPQLAAQLSENSTGDTALGTWWMPQWMTLYIKEQGLGSILIHPNTQGLPEGFGSGAEEKLWECPEGRRVWGVNIDKLIVLTEVITEISLDNKQSHPGTHM